MTTGKDIIKLTALTAGAVVLKSALNHLIEYDLKNKTVLITGGSRGLGLVMAREFAHEGARLALCARDEEELQRAQSHIESHGAEVMTVPCDITSKQSVDDMVATVNLRFGGRRCWRLLIKFA
jgi:NAD(P)-dependent dehydrogenase (short-subunit alcohol dehydrogenase family)